MQVVQQLEIQVGMVRAKDTWLKSFLLSDSTCRVSAALCRRGVVIRDPQRDPQLPGAMGAHFNPPSQ